MNGVIHALNNQYSERWRSRVDHTGGQAIAVNIDLSRANELPKSQEPQVIEGEALRKLAGDHGQPEGDA